MSQCEHEFEPVLCEKCGSEAFYCTKCGEAEIVVVVNRLKAERDYAIKQWVSLENKYEVPRHNAGEPWTFEEMLVEISKNLTKSCED